MIIETGDDGMHFFFSWREVMLKGFLLLIGFSIAVFTVIMYFLSLITIDANRVYIEAVMVFMFTIRITLVFFFSYIMIRFFLSKDNGLINVIQYMIKLYVSLLKIIKNLKKKK